MDTTNNNPLLCDIETGMCAVPEINDTTNNSTIATAPSTIKVLYFTDPICSSCWGIEPQLRKLKLEYGHLIDIDYKMGGLLPDWKYNSGGISKPADVAHHWDEVSAYYNMPIDGDVWLEDPLSSSYPPSIAFKAAQMQHKEKAVVFLRVMREMLFLQKKNICKWEHLHKAAQHTGLDVVQLQKDADGEANNLFAEDLQLAQQLGVRGFPTLFFADSNGNQEKVYGYKPYAVFENVISKLQPTAEKQPYASDWQSLFSKFASLTAKEFAELSATPIEAATALLQELSTNGQLDIIETKNGHLWRKK